jgi:hypothetical protein
MSFSVEARFNKIINANWETHTMDVAGHLERRSGFLGEFCCFCRGSKKFNDEKALIHVCDLIDEYLTKKPIDPAEADKWETEAGKRRDIVHSTGEKLKEFINFSKNVAPETIARVNRIS